MKAKGKTGLNTGQVEIERVKEKLPTKEKLDNNDKGVLYFLIVYILKNYSDADHVRTPKEVMDLTCEIFGTNREDQKGRESTTDQKDGKRKYSKALYSIPSEKTFKRYLEGLSNFSTLYTYFGDKDSSAQVIRRFLGGSVVRVEGKQKQQYYFKSDYDTRDFDVIRSFTDEGKNPDLKGTLVKIDSEYIREICDNVSPHHNKKSWMDVDTIADDFPQDWEKTWSKFDRHVLNKTKGTKNDNLHGILTPGFFGAYHFISDAIEKEQEITIEWVDTTTGNRTITRLKPKRFIWEKNWFCLKGENLQTNNLQTDDLMTIRLDDIFDVSLG